MFKKKGVLFLREEYGEGFGKYTYLDGEKYEGDWRNGKYHGHGTLTFPDGTKYEGKFKDGKENGQGTYTWSSGSRYVGEWKDDKEWNGTDYNKNENIIGKFVNGVRNKP